MLDEQEQPLNFHEELLERIQPKLYAYILAIVANAADAKDVLQETNRVILAKIGDLKQADRFNAWSYRIAYFQSLSFLKKRKRHKLNFSEGLLEDIADLNETIDAQLERKLSRLELCLAKLQDRSRAIVSDYYYHGMSLKDIASKRKLVANHVAQILYRARQALFQCITQTETSDYE